MKPSKNDDKLSEFEEYTFNKKAVIPLFISVIKKTSSGMAFADHVVTPKFILENDVKYAEIGKVEFKAKYSN
ncbi:MAG: hypothetical protein HQM08_26790 [Candidatus Riflebacteria bacterium]|nr:hypothetical protein [Candidatus Riflebacteria bacterium]